MSLSTRFARSKEVSRSVSTMRPNPMIPTARAPCEGQAPKGMSMSQLPYL
jgi:hypothetical protein